MICELARMWTEVVVVFCRKKNSDI